MNKTSDESAMKSKFTLADKSYYIVEYLSELAETNRLSPRTVCEKYKHSRRGETGVVVTPGEALGWAREVAEVLHSRSKRV